MSNQPRPPLISVEFAPQAVGNPSGYISVRINESYDLFVSQLVGKALQATTWQCPFPDNLVLEGAVIEDSTVIYSACQTISAGTGFTIGRGAFVTLEAGTRVSLKPGFQLMATGQLIIRKLQSE